MKAKEAWAQVLNDLGEKRTAPFSETFCWAYTGSNAFTLDLQRCMPGKRYGNTQTDEVKTIVAIHYTQPYKSSPRLKRADKIDVTISYS